MTEVFPKSYHSGFSPEDLPSDEAGIEFGIYMQMHPDLSIAEAFYEWAARNGARDIDDPKSGYTNLPPQDPALPVNGESRPGSNESSTPPEKKSSGDGSGKGGKVKKKHSCTGSRIPVSASTPCTSF